MVSYDGLVLAAVAAELTRTVVGGRISRVRQHNDTDITLEIRTRGREALLFASADAQFPRVYLAAGNPPVPHTPPNFCMVLRKYVKGSFLKAIQQMGFDRVLHIRTEAPDGNRNTLVVEIMGKHSNLILLNDAGRILGAAKMIGPSASRYRQVLPGRDYIPPPGSKANILEVSRDQYLDLWSRGPGDDADASKIQAWLVSTFAGVGAFLGREIVIRAGEPTAAAVWQEIARLQETVAASDFTPVVHTDPHGRLDFVYPQPSVQIEGEQHPRTSISEALDAYYRSVVPRWKLDRLREQLAADIRKASEARDLTLASLQEAALAGGQAERLQRLGEMLTASIGSIPRGAAEAEVTDYYDPALPTIRVPLDPRLSAQENAEAYFNKARKARSGANAAVGRMEAIREEMTLLRAAAEKLQDLASEDEVRSLRRFLEERHALRQSGSAAGSGQQEAEFPGHRIRRHVSADGLEILVGENSESNDYLTTRIARPDDVWLHARAVKGAHVVVRTSKKGLSIPASTLRQAANLAARNSEARHSSLIPVDYTLRKYVRKPKGAAPGYVTYSHERTIDVSGDE